MNKKDPKATNTTGKKPGTARRQAKPKVTKPTVEVQNVPETPAAAIAIQPAVTPTSTEMEVHHHPDLHHKPKPWKEYLLECLMIFIAVMMGFIAENIREEITNSEHAKHLTLQLIHDLRTDSATLDKIYNFETHIEKDNDMLFDILQQPLAKVDAKKLQQLLGDSHGMFPFHPSGGAIGAIKNELQLKQFTNSDIISYISQYERHTELLRSVQDITLQYQRNLLEPFMLEYFTPANLSAAFNNSPSTISGQMQNLTQDDLTKLASRIVLIRRNNKELVDDNRLVKEDVTQLLKYVIKQYNLQDE
jgi:hypothetical protein